MKKHPKQAFTLVELIVVITILAILGTIAFISLQGYSKQARDSRRVSDISNIRTSLEMFSLNTGKYPLPDEGYEVSYNTDLLRTQGIVGDNVTQNLSNNLSKKSTDPLHDIPYIYSTTHSQKEYELLSFYEGDLSISPLLQRRGGGGEGITHAANILKPKISGNYNGIFVRTANNTIPTPSIINSEIDGGNITLDTNNIKSQILSAGDNFPIVNVPGTENITGQLDILFNPVGVITSTSTDAEKIAVIEGIQSAYSGSSLAGDSLYDNILSKTTDTEKLNLTSYLFDGGNISSPQSSGIGGNDEYTKLLIQSDIDYSTYNIVDGFDGTEINTDKWRNIGTTDSTQNDKIIQSVSGGTLDYAILTSKLKFSSDFNIQIDFNNLAVPAVTYSNLSFRVRDKDNNAFTIIRNRDSSSNTYKTYRILGGIWTQVGTNTNTTDTSGKFKIIRTGNALTSYYWNSTQFIEDETLIMSELGDVYIDLDLSSAGSFPAISAEWDNFQINLGTFISDKFTDSSIIANTITSNGNVHHSTTYKKFGNTSMYFDGDGDYLSIDDSEDLNFGDEDFTVDLWVRPDSTNNTEIISKRVSGGSYMSLIIGIYNGNYSFRATSSSSTWNIANYNTFGVVEPDTWTHLAVSREGSNWYLFKNGNLEKTFTSDLSILNDTTPLGIGLSGSLGWYKGNIDEIRISKGTARRTKNFTPPTQPYSE